ncbi:GTP cyclohydrolase I [Caldicellulosiruptor kronotskyensis 2002]|uniref:GTP cyclohydrolase FolE2 n=1 Tax=Caldicellulosiruptor kronotskyensis (strain DSM 18902 / VKM B-2412 / 2002) TaxID=632348 RepID=E4SH08_CALK2|nr:GTP cyclohydrolase FolE2 [Caldicellulosiruptor kronotskyensis]ADQ47033.1 GTP cyclohydrolase I [Caldicellulosiruptor kronotskyensis 2002]
MIDVQSQKDLRGISIQKVGIKDLNWPIVVMDRENKTQTTIAKIIAAAELKGDIRGTHMSRFIEAIDELKVVGPKEIEKLLDRIKEKLNSEKAYIRFDFPYFINKRTPVTATLSPLKVDCYFEAEKDQKFDLKVGVIVPVHTLCPCSKEISEYGAHNQRAYVTIEVRMKKFMWIEELVEIAEASASCPLYSILKRPDEKWVTERAYQNPRFVEDLLREVVLKIKEDNRIKWYKVFVESIESIHNHNAFAYIEGEITK